MPHFWFAAVLVLAWPASGPPAPGPARTMPSAQPVPPLTVEQAVTIALDKHPSVRAYEFGIEAAREQTAVARSAYYPTIEASGGYARWERHAFLPEGMGSPTVASVIGPTNDWFAGLSGRYLLFDSGERAARVRTALAGERVSAAEATQYRQDLALAVREAFYGLAAALQAQDAAAQEDSRAREHLRMAEARKAAGAVAGADVIRARVGVSEARLHVVSAGHLVDVAAGRLNTAMGLPAETPVHVDAGPTAAVPPAARDFRDVVERAVAARPSLAAGAARIDAARGALDAAQSQFGPRLSTDWRAGVRDAEWWPDDRDWSAGFTVQVPLFDGHSRARARNRARAELAQTEAKQAANQLDVRREVWDARSRLEESYESARTAEVLVGEAEESLRVARERYRVGAGTLTDLLDAEAALARALATRVQSLLEHRTAQARFTWATGELLIP